MLYRKAPNYGKAAAKLSRVQYCGPSSRHVLGPLALGAPLSPVGGGAVIAGQAPLLPEPPEPPPVLELVLAFQCLYPFNPCCGYRQRAFYYAITLCNELC